MRHTLTSTDEAITDVLRDWTGGNTAALSELLQQVYEELKKLAHAHLAKEFRGNPLQTTELVNELYLRLTTCREVAWRSRAQFYAFAGKLMRNILVDYAREREAKKRGAGTESVSITEAVDVGEQSALDLTTIVALDIALKRLYDLDPRAAEVVELRFFSGLSNPEIAEHLNVSISTVKRDWEIAQHWLAREVGN